jgi:Lrp/AsnC family leucine-responsive transcriptional regulator
LVPLPVPPLRWRLPPAASPASPPDSLALDDFDLAILDILQRDNTTPQRAIAEAVHLSAPAVQRRIRRLQDSGVIRANVALLDAARLGRPLTILLKLAVHDENPARTAPLHRRIAAEPAVQQCWNITGDADYLLVVNVASMDDYTALVQRLIGGDGNVRRFGTSVAMGCLKSGLQVPLVRG